MSSNAKQHFSLFIFSWSILVAAGYKIFFKSFNILNGQGFIQDQKNAFFNIYPFPILRK